MDAAVKAAMDQGGVADITTVGRRSGLPRRVEIYFHHFDGDYYLTGRPGRKRDWESNIAANPEFTLHLKWGVRADVAVLGESEPNRELRAEVILRALTESWGSDFARATAALDRWVDTAPFIRFRPL